MHKFSVLPTVGRGREHLTVRYPTEIPNRLPGLTTAATRLPPVRLCDPACQCGSAEGVPVDQGVQPGAGRGQHDLGHEAAR